jgi:hypothetical protein
VTQERVQDMAVDNVYSSPTGKHNGSDTTDGPDTDATLPVPTHMLAVQFEQFRAQLSVFPHGHRGHRGSYFVGGDGARVVAKEYGSEVSTLPISN